MTAPRRQVGDLGDAQRVPARPGARAWLFMYAVSNRREERDRKGRVSVTWTVDRETAAPRPLRPEQARLEDAIVASLARKPRRSAVAKHDSAKGRAAAERQGQLALEERVDKSATPAGLGIPSSPRKSDVFVVRYWYESEGGEILCADSEPVTTQSADALRAALRPGQGACLAAEMLDARWVFDVATRRGRWIGVGAAEPDVAVSVCGVPQMGPLTAPDPVTASGFVQGKKTKRLTITAARLVQFPPPGYSRPDDEDVGGIHLTGASEAPSVETS